MTYYVDVNGNYLGSWIEATPPLDAFEVPIPPDNALTEIYVNGAWVDKPKSPEQLIAEAKAKKAEALANITVTTTSGKVFDGDESARNNMLSAIAVADFLGKTSADWKLADNTIQIITLVELKEALALSIQKVGEIIGIK